MDNYTPDMAAQFYEDMFTDFHKRANEISEAVNALGFRCDAGFATKEQVTYYNANTMNEKLEAIIAPIMTVTITDRVYSKYSHNENMISHSFYLHDFKEELKKFHHRALEDCYLVLLEKKRLGYDD